MRGPFLVPDSTQTFLKTRKPVKQEPQKVRTKTSRDSRLQEKYGIGEEELQQMYTEQGGKCPVCERVGHIDERTGGKGPSASVDGRPCLVVDHCHATDEVRGLLCVSCNLVVGNNSPRLLVRAAFYVQEAEKALSLGQRRIVAAYRKSKGKD